jgi:hypothetical protein
MRHERAHARGASARMSPPRWSSRQLVLVPGLLLPPTSSARPRVSLQVAPGFLPARGCSVSGCCAVQVVLFPWVISTHARRQPGCMLCCVCWCRYRTGTGAEILLSFFRLRTSIHSFTGLQSSVSRRSIHVGAECHSPNLMSSVTCFANI